MAVLHDAASGVSLIATAAVRQLAARAFADLRDVVIEAETLPANVASIGVLRNGRP